MSDLAEQIREALAMFARNGTAPALIGGLAVVAHSVLRATKDVDFLVEVEAADRVHDPNRTCSMNFSDSTDTSPKPALNLADAGAVLVREAGVPFQPPTGSDSGIDPIATMHESTT